jgi:hypothetical protein
MGPVHTTMQRNAAQKYEQVKWTLKPSSMCKFVSALKECAEGEESSIETCRRNSSRRSVRLVCVLRWRVCCL